MGVFISVYILNIMLLCYGLFKDFFHGKVFHAETNQLISNWNQVTGSYVLQDFGRWNLLGACNMFL